MFVFLQNTRHEKKIEKEKLDFFSQLDFLYHSTIDER